MRDCKQCRSRFRADYLVRSALFEFPSIPAEIPTIHALLEECNLKSPVAIIVGEEGDRPEDQHERVKRALRAKKLNWHRVPRCDAPFGGAYEPFVQADSRYFYVLQQFAGHAAQADACPQCGGELTEPRAFNLMFKTNVGALEDASSTAYLRPETAQGIFTNFKNVMDSTRVKIPFGIAQIGKAFRNEINPRNYTFRSREFEQMEIEFFCKPPEHCRPGEQTSMDWYEFWRDVRIKWYESLNIKSEKLRPRQQDKDELAHYSDACTDIEYLFPFSNEPQELEGVAHRGDFDLKAHGKASKNKEDAFAVVDDDPSRDREGAVAAGASKQPAARYVPHVIEPSAGVDRFALAVITEAYSYDESRASPEFMRFHPRLAPIKAAVFPLVAKDGMPEIAEPIYREIKKHFPCQYDAKQSIGKRYARMDEAGTPFCFTIDGRSKEDGTVTVRNRDDASQVRIDKSRCLQYLRDQLGL